MINTSKLLTELHHTLQTQKNTWDYVDSSNRNYYSILELKTTSEGTFYACVMVASGAQKKYEHVDFQILSFVVKGLLVTSRLQLASIHQGKGKFIVS